MSMKKILKNLDGLVIIYNVLYLKNCFFVKYFNRKINLCKSFSFFFNVCLYSRCYLKRFFSFLSNGFLNFFIVFDA